MDPRSYHTHDLRITRMQRIFSSLCAKNLREIGVALEIASECGLF